MIPRSTGAPPDISAVLAAAAEQWLSSSSRPRPEPGIVRHWDALIDAWVSNPEYPLIVRKSGDRGCETRHPSGRTVVCVDNSPAHWTLACAIRGDLPSGAELLAALTSGEWPVVFAMSKAEADRLPRFRGVLARSQRAKVLNDGEWKVCHIDGVGLSGRGGVEGFPIATLTEACRRLLAPSNMFLVPNSHAGFGELPEVVEVFRRAVHGPGVSAITRSEEDSLRDAVVQAVETLETRDRDLLMFDAHEVSITHRIAVYLEPLVGPDWHVDCEYNRVGTGVDPKRAVHGAIARPDIAVHHRGKVGPEHNLLVIEVKPDATGNADHDRNKLREYKLRFGYRHAFFVDLERLRNATPGVARRAAIQAE